MHEVGNLKNLYYFVSYFHYGVYFLVVISFMSDKQLYYLLFKCSTQHPKPIVYDCVIR